MKPKGITIQITPGIDDDTAELALKIVQLYCNKDGRCVDAQEMKNGEIKLFFIDRY